MQILMEVPLADYIDSLDASVDSCYDDEFDCEWLFDEKVYDGCIPDLVRSIQGHGFLAPICCQVTDSDMHYQGNGHHRLVVAILLCLDTIPVLFSDEEYMHRESTECNYPEGTYEANYNSDKPFWNLLFNTLDEAWPVG